MCTRPGATAWREKTVLFYTSQNMHYLSYLSAGQFAHAQKRHRSHPHAHSQTSEPASQRAAQHEQSTSRAQHGRPCTRPTQTRIMGAHPEQARLGLGMTDELQAARPALPQVRARPDPAISTLLAVSRQVRALRSRVAVGKPGRGRVARAWRPRDPPGMRLGTGYRAGPA